MTSSLISSNCNIYCSISRQSPDVSAVATKQEIQILTLSAFVTDDFAVEIQKGNEIIKWSVKEYAHVIRQ